MVTTRTEKIMMIIGALMGWAALTLQFYLIIQNRVVSIPETIIRFFSYFTILTNIIVAVSYSAQIAGPGSTTGKFWAPAKTQAAVGVYILVVGIVYNAVLRFLWAPTGLQKMTDELLHTVVPAWYLIYWIIFAPKKGLQWRYALSWLWVPFIYLVYILVRGVFTNNYPYPFLDAYNFGYARVGASSVVIMMLFLILSLVFIALGRRIARKLPDRGN